MCKGFYDLDTVPDHLCCGSPVGLDQFPRGIGLDVGVAERGKHHDRINRTLELVVPHQLVDRCKGLLDLGHDRRVDRARRDTLELLLGKVERAVHEVAEDVDHFVVDPLAKDLPREVQFLGVARVREQVVAEVVRGKSLIEIIVVGPDHVAPSIGGLQNFRPLRVTWP